MAIFNRVLDFFNGDMGPVEPQRFQVPMSQPYVDDIFDPLFNRDVVSYNRGLYGPLGAIPAGYAQMWENALTGREGILGPGMGVLSTFGRSMDKADDFILGGLTEGVNALGRFTGTNDAPSNPISNIFVEDRDYEGSDLLAAMGNAMGKLAGGVKLDRSDFNSLPDRLQSSALNLATDPGFMGGSIARANPANRAAQALSDYDDFMANVSGNMALPGLKASAQAGLKGLIRLVGGTENAPLADYAFSDGAKFQLRDMMNDYAKVGGTDVLDDYEYAVYRSMADDGMDFSVPKDLEPGRPTLKMSAEDLLGSLEEDRVNADTNLFGTLEPGSPVLRRPGELIPTSDEIVDLPKLLREDPGTAQDLLDTVYAKLDAIRQSNPNNPLFNSSDEASKFMEDYEYATGASGKGASDDAALIQQIQDMYENPNVSWIVNDALGVSGPNAKVSGSAYLAVSDAGSRKATAKHYAAAREAIFNEASLKLSPRFRHGASSDEEAVANAFAEYSRRKPSDLTAGIAHATKAYYGSTHQAYGRLLSNTLRHPSDNVLPFKVLDTYLSKKGGATAADAVRASLNDNYVFNKTFTPKDYSYEKVCRGFRDYFNSLGADLPESAGFDEIAKWYSDNRSFVELSKMLIEMPEDAMASNLAKILSEANMSKEMSDSVEKWFRLQLENPAKSYAKYLENLPMSKLDDVKLKDQEYIQKWHDSQNAVLKRRSILQNGPKGNPNLEAQLKDIEVLDEFADRLQRLELAASTTTPEYIRSMHDSKWISPATVRDVLWQGTTSEYIGNSMKSMMDYLDEHPSGTGINPLDWVVRRGRKVLADDVKNGRQVRPEGQFLATVAKRSSATLDDWKSILTPSKDYFNATKYHQLLEGAKFRLTPDGDILDLTIPATDKQGKFLGYKFNPMLTPSNARTAAFWFNPKTLRALRGISVESDGIHVGRDAFNYFTRHAEDHRFPDFAEVAKESRLDPKFHHDAAFNDWGAEDVAKLATDPPHMGDEELYSLSDDLTAPIAEHWNVPHLDPLDPDDITFIKRVGTPKDQTLFAYISRMAVKSRNAKLNRGGTAFLNDRSVDVIKRAKAAMAKYKPEMVREYIRQRDASTDSIVEAKDFVGSLVNSEGFKVKALRGDDAELRAVLTSNVNKVNKAVGEDILKVVDVPGKTKSDVSFLGYAFNTENPKIKKHLNEFAKRYDGESLGLQDVVFHKGTGTYGQGLDPDMVKELDGIFDDTTSLLNEYTGRLGFTPFKDGYIRHDLTDDLGNDFGFTKHKSDLRVAKARDVAAALSDIRAFDERTHRALGTKAFDRSWYGDFDIYGTGFSGDAEVIVKSTFTKGALDNSNAALAQELFFNGNFSLKRNFHDPRQLMDALRQEGSSNMTNLQIVVPRYDANGVISGFTRVDPYDDAAIAKAFDNDEAILAPKSIFGRLDRVLRKEAKMSSGAYRFIQKYLTVPFKLGVISNLGFLFGNVQDASFKQVESFMRRYGTSLDDECFNAAASYKHAVELQNRFSDVVDRYVEFLGTDVDKSAYKNSLATLRKTGTVDMALITSNPHYFDEFVTWMSSQPKEVADAAHLYLFAHSIMDAGTFENNYLDLEDLTQAGNKEAANRYDVPLNVADRVFYGDRSAGEKSFEHGPFKGKRLNKFGLVTNPATNAILRPSNEWEHTTRLATVLNYMRHEGWTDERISEALGLPFDDDTLQKLRMDMVQGVDMMNHANFDYDDVTDFMDKVSLAVPFPTFYLKNIAHWMEAFADNPQMIDDIVSYQEGLWQNKGVKDDEFAAEAKGRGAYPVGGRTKLGTGIVKQSPVNSMFSAFSAANNFKEDFAYRTNPLARPLTRHLQDAEDVKYRPYSMDPYEKNVRRGDPQFSELSYMFHQLNPYERYVNTYLRTPRKVASNDYQASDFLPSVFQPDFGKKRR